ncbi:transposase [Dactylosporangium sp. NPDC051485]|uniref:transposase n=1 Tax=Dactylosporangium sp. NPDC051485 TaxID=3154846 RepID=UPI00343F7E58
MTSAPSTGSAAPRTSRPGTAPPPIEASSGDQQRHRLSRAGDRRINRVLHIMAVVQLRRDTPGRVYYRRRLTEGKTTMEALGALKRHLSDVVYKRMVQDAKRARTDATGPGGHSGATLQSSADGPIPTAASSDKSQPGPAIVKRRTKLGLTRFDRQGRCVDPQATLRAVNGRTLVLFSKAAGLR